jgi:hypothetical protein
MLGTDFGGGGGGGWAPCPHSLKTFVTPRWILLMRKRFGSHANISVGQVTLDDWGVEALALFFMTEI